jgi:tRNA-modifying protein YgfZ
MEQTFSEYKLLSEQGGAFSLQDYALIEFTGDEWKEWLQGQITNDIKLLTSTNPISFCLCKPTAQILAPGTLHLINGNGRMIVPLVCAPAVLIRVEQMVILEECFAEILEIDLFHIIPGADGFPATRTKWSGRDASTKPESTLLSQETFLLASLEAKVPLWGQDISELNFPAELGQEFERTTMSYTKGCYTGQEINHRLHSRGHTNKTWDVYLSETPYAVGQDILDDQGTKVGTATRSSIHADLGWLVGAFVRNGLVPVLPRFQP